MSQRIVRMADGISRHKGEEKFPPQLDDAALLVKRQELEVLREQYELLSKQAAQAHGVLDALMTSLDAELARDDEAVRGFYGKANGVVSEFGTMVVTPHGGRKPKASAGATADAITKADALIHARNTAAARPAKKRSTKTASRG